VECANLRALALAKLNRWGDADAAAAASLAREPEQAAAQALRGLQRLRAGDFDSASGHLREALRLDPDAAPVRAALLEALKARNPLYAAILRLQRGWSRLSPLARLGLLIAFLAVLQRTGSGVAGGSEQSLGALVALVMAFEFIGLVLVLFNVTLLADPFSRMALGRTAVRTATAVAVGVVAAVGALAAGVLTGRPGCVLAAFGLTFAARTAATAGGCPPGWRRRVASCCAGVVAGLALGATFANPGGSHFILGAFAAVAVGFVGPIGLQLARVFSRTRRSR
jgi:hypothetical protein